MVKATQDPAALTAARVARTPHARRREKERPLPDDEMPSWHVMGGLYDLGLDVAAVLDIYAHAGGVGVRTGHPRDVGRLLLAGLFQQALVDRAGGRHEEAAELFDLAARRFPDDPEARLAAAEATLTDRKDPAAALDALRKLDEPEGAHGIRFRKRLLVADALAANGQRDEAIAALTRLDADFPGAPGVARRLEALRSGKDGGL